MSEPRFPKVASLIVAAALLFSPNAKPQAKVEKVKKLFAARGIEKLAYTAYRKDALAGPMFEAYEITENKPSPKLLESFDASGPTYAPDGTMIAICEGRSESVKRISVLNTEGGNPKKVWKSQGRAFVRRISWSHDGKRLAFSDFEDRKSQIFVVSVDGSGLHAVAEGDWPSWSPDDRQLVYERQVGPDENSDLAIWVVNVDGSEARPLTNDKSKSFEPNWLPSGRGIVFASMSEGKSAIYAMDPNGGHVRLIMRSEEYYLSAPSISPDGRTLVCNIAKGPIISSSSFWIVPLRKITKDPLIPSSSLWIVPLDGQGEAVVLTSGFDASVVWHGK